MADSAAMARISMAVLTVVLVVAAACAAPAPTTPVPTPTPATATATTTPAATTDVATEVVAAFRQRFGEEQPPFHVDANVLVTGSAEAVVSIAMDASGEDYQGTVHAEVGDEISDVEVVFLDGIAYGRSSTGDWESSPTSARRSPSIRSVG